MELLAQGIARAMNAPGLRRQILDDLRDSPFPKHRLHLNSYRRGARGQLVAVGAARELGITPPELFTPLDGLPEMELRMPGSYDRIFWSGNDQVVLVGTALKSAQSVATPVEFFTGYTPRGEAVAVPTAEYFAPALLMIAPADGDFGANPEATRRAAPPQTRESISTPEEEHATMSGDCDPNDPNAIQFCDGGVPTGGDPGPQEYQLTYSLTECSNSAGTDADFDGPLDACEYELASAFAPMLSISSLDREPYRDSFWSVRYDPVDNEVEIFYLLGYYRDPGTPTGNYAAHDGDSEFLVAAVVDITGSGLWSIRAMAFSAHYQAWYGAGDRTATHRFDSLEYTDAWRGRPRVYVSQDKHANFDRGANCDGSLGDDCKGNFDWAIVSVRQDRNIGNYGAPFGRNRQLNCVSVNNFPGPTECMWTDAKFRGWQTEGGHGAGGYKMSQEEYGF